MNTVEGAWQAYRHTYCRNTCRLFCVVVRTHAWEINWHLDQLIAALDRL